MSSITLNFNKPSGNTNVPELDQLLGKDLLDGQVVLVGLHLLKPVHLYVASARNSTEVDTGFN